MNGIVFECKKDGVIVMDKLGCFRYVQGFTDRQIGSEIVFRAKQEVDTAKSIVFGLPLATIRRAALVAACAVFVFALGMFTNHWFTEAYYIEIDGIADIELGFNSMNVLISATGLNDEGVELLENNRFSGHVSNVSSTALSAGKASGYHVSGEDEVSFLVITVIAHNEEKGMAVRGALEEYCILSAQNRDSYEHGRRTVRSLVPISTDYRHCGMAERDEAREAGVSACKLLLAKHLTGMDSSILLDDIIDLPIDDIHSAVYYEDALMSLRSSMLAAPSAR